MHKKHPVSGKNDFSEKNDAFFSAVQKVQHWRKKYNSIEEIPDSLIPDEWDFRNIGGFDFTGPVRDQLECGSCYTLGFIQAAEARLKVKYAHKGALPQLSAQHALECNYMNEGCDGGWAIFHGFFAERAHLIDEQCGPYKARTKGDKCSNY